MLSNKLMTLLATFNKADLARFRKYLQSPYCNEHEDLLRLFLHIEEHLRSAPDEAAALELDKALVWAMLFEDRAYNDTTMRRLSFELHQHACQFLIFERTKEDTIDSQLILLDHFARVGLEKHYRGVQRQLEKHLDSQPEKTADRYRQTLQWQQLVHQKIEKSRPKKPSFDHLERADFSLDGFYLLQKLRYYCDALGYRLFLSQEAHISLPPQLLSYVETHFLEEAPIKAYYLVAQMLSHPQETTFFYELKKYLLAAEASIERRDLQVLYIHLQNYCIYVKINTGYTSFFEELFYIQQTLIGQEIIFENGVLDPQYYKNIITVGLHVKAFDWVEQFIQQYTDRLPEANQENALNYNLAKVYFHQENYEQVIELLREVEYKNINYALGGKLMLLKTYYELGEYLALDSLADSFRIYLQRNKMISRSVKQQYLNLLRFVKKLSNIAPYDKAAIAKIQHDAQTSKSLADKNWVFEKIRELQGNQAATAKS
jgi:hypothetical protein